MKVLFISSGNSKDGISPIIKNQGASLQRQGLEVVFFTIKGKGIKGYLKNIIPLKQFLNKHTFDVVHAHYSLSAFVASLACAKPLVVSLMGSDVKSGKFFMLIIRLFNAFFWSQIIVKSKDMESTLGLKKVEVIPNGVDFDKFKPINQAVCKKALGWDLAKKQVLFAASPGRKVKNYQLADKAFNLMQDNECELKVLESVPNHMIPQYHNAADVVLLTSLWEGSPNVIKEAMACNRTIVATDVGDIRWLFGGVKGSFITSFEANNLTEKLKEALIKNKVNTKDRIISLGLDSGVIARRIIDIYTKVI